MLLIPRASPKLLFSQRGFYTCPKAQNSLHFWDKVVWNLGKQTISYLKTDPPFSHPRKQFPEVLQTQKAAIIKY